MNRTDAHRLDALEAQVRRMDQALRVLTAQFQVVVDRLEHIAHATDNGLTDAAFHIRMRNLADPDDLSVAGGAPTSDPEEVPDNGQESERRRGPNPCAI
jgi:hypothetical protein